MTCWLAPVILGKLFSSTLWINKSEWVQELSKKEKDYWVSYKENVLLLEKIRVPRWISSKMVQ